MCISCVTNLYGRQDRRKIACIYIIGELEEDCLLSLLVRQKDHIICSYN